MAFQTSICILMAIFIAIASISPSHAYIFEVGGRDGWTLHPTESYSHWAGRLRFQINDTLHFRYNGGSDSVLVVNRGDYDGCNADSPIMKLEGGDSTFKFDRSGPFYFITGNKSNCDQGQKLIVVVLALRSPPPPPAVATPPSPAVSPVVPPSPSSVSPVSPPPAVAMPPSPAVSPVLPPSPSAVSPVSPPPSVATPPSPAVSPVLPPSPSAVSPVSPPPSVVAPPSPAVSPVSPPSETPVLTPPPSSPGGGGAPSPPSPLADTTPPPSPAADTTSPPSPSAATPPCSGGVIATAVTVIIVLWGIYY